jgi:hypothetical protein
MTVQDIVEDALRKQPVHIRGPCNSPRSILTHRDVPSTSAKRICTKTCGDPLLRRNLPGRTAPNVSPQIVRSSIAHTQGDRQLGSTVARRSAQKPFTRKGKLRTLVMTQISIGQNASAHLALAFPRFQSLPRCSQFIIAEYLRPAR